MAKTANKTIPCPNCGDASRRNQRPLNDEDNQFQCHKCGMVYRLDPPIKTYEAKTPDGQTVRCTVPESDNREWPELLVEAVRETISPKAVVSIVAHLQAASTKDADVDRQVAWFADHLIQMLGANEYPRLCERLGL